MLGEWDSAFRHGQIPVVDLDSQNYPYITKENKKLLQDDYDFLYGANGLINFLSYNKSGRINLQIRVRGELVNANL